MTTLKSLPIVILLALATLGCDQAMDLDELEASEAELGADEVSAMLEAEDEDFDEDDYETNDLDDEVEGLGAHHPLPIPDEDDLDITAGAETVPDPPTIDDVTDVHRLPDPDPAPETVPCQAPGYPLPADPINDLEGDNGHGPDPGFQIDDLAARPLPGCNPDPYVPFEEDDQEPLPPYDEIDDVTYGEDEPEPDVWPIDDLSAGEGS